MSATAAVPVTITPEAVAHLRRVGLEREYQQIVEYIQQTAPDLRRVESVLDYDKDAPVPERLVISPIHPVPEEIDLSWENDFDRWLVTTFPYTVRCHFVVLPRFEESHGR